MRMQISMKFTIRQKRKLAWTWCWNNCFHQEEKDWNFNQLLPWDCRTCNNSSGRWKLQILFLGNQQLWKLGVSQWLPKSNTRSYVPNPYCQYPYWCIWTKGPLLPWDCQTSNNASRWGIQILLLGDQQLWELGMKQWLPKSNTRSYVLNPYHWYLYWCILMQGPLLLWDHRTHNNASSRWWLPI